MSGLDVSACCRNEGDRESSGLQEPDVDVQYSSSAGGRQRPGVDYTGGVCGVRARTRRQSAPAHVHQGDRHQTAPVDVVRDAGGRRRRAGRGTAVEGITGSAAGRRNPGGVD